MSLLQIIHLPVCRQESLALLSAFYSFTELQNSSKTMKGANPIASGNLESYVLRRPIFLLQILNNLLVPFQKSFTVCPEMGNVWRLSNPCMLELPSFTCPFLSVFSAPPA